LRSPTQAEIQPDAPFDKRSYGPGSLGRLVSEYLKSGEYVQLKPRTQAEYKRVLESLQPEHGHKTVGNLRRRHIRKMRDAKAETPGAANTIVRMLKLLLSFAVDEEWIDVNRKRCSASTFQAGSGCGLKPSYERSI
jgi:hypothetical protein